MAEAAASAVPTWSVGELHEALNGMLSHVFGDELWIEGELRNFKRSANQHVYFDLVDPTSTGDASPPMLAVTLFSRERQAVNRFLTAQGGTVRMGDGVRVRIRGRLNVYEARSTLQLRMSWIDPTYTLGVMGQERDRVMASLVSDGVLERNAAIAIPPMPLRVALVTSVGSAAHADALDELACSGVGFSISVLDARTQGADAALSITAALRAADGMGVDVILLVRGGGARTDLAVFDSEVVARSIVASTRPVVTGIGHEIDRTVADEVAHTSLKTPTAAAAWVVDRATRVVASVHDLSVEVDLAARGRLSRAGATIERAAERAGHSAARHLVRDRQSVDQHAVRVRVAAPRAARQPQTDLAALHARLAGAAARRVERAGAALEPFAARARAHDPAIALARGWSMTRTEDGRIVRSVNDAVPGDRLSTVVSDGTVSSVVEEPSAQEQT